MANPDQKTILLEQVYDEIKDWENAIMYARLAHLVFMKGNDKAKMQEAKSFIEALEKKYGDKAL